MRGVQKKIFSVLGNLGASALPGNFHITSVGLHWWPSPSLCADKEGISMGGNE